jgi:hypothetical protein
VNLRGVIIYVARSRYFCNHGVNTAQSLKFWAIEGRVAGALNSSADKGQSAAELANATVERMHFCHGQPGGVFSGHETIGGANNGHFLRHFYILKTIFLPRQAPDKHREGVLPRQAPDKHRESTQKRVAFFLT